MRLYNWCALPRAVTLYYILYIYFIYITYFIYIINIYKIYNIYGNYIYIICYIYLKYPSIYMFFLVHSNVLVISKCLKIVRLLYPEIVE